MNLKAAIVAHLRQQTALGVLVGDRIYHQYRDTRTALPAVVFHVISTQRYRSLTEANGATAPSRLRTSRVQFDCYGRTGAEAEAVMAALTRPQQDGGIDGFRGKFADVTIQCCHFGDEAGHDEYEPSPHGDDGGPHLVTADAMITYEG